VAQRKSFGFIPIVVMVACGGTSRSHDPGGSGAVSGTGVTGGSGGSKAGNGGRGGTGNVAGRGGPSETGGTSGSGDEAGRGGSSDTGGTGASGAVAGSDPQGGAAGRGVYVSGGSETCGPGGCVPDGPGEPIDPPGPVYCGGVECPAASACCVGTGECFDPQRNPEACPEPPQDDDLWGRKACTSNSHCTERQFCQMDTLSCLGSGHCQPRANCGSCFGECTVCGCDGNTYPDQQTACLAGAQVLLMGACGEPVSNGAGGGAGTGGGAGSGGGTPRVKIPCGYSDQCPADQVCCARFGECMIGDPQLCTEPPEGASRPCKTDDHCEPYEYCLGEGCEGPGGCVSIGSQGACGVRLEPVCGCNGVSYTSAACA
jgi:hypothetical protein